MRSLLTALALIVLVPAVRAQTAAPSAPADDIAGVRAALDAYLRGHATGDGAHMREAFHPSAQLFFNRNGTFSTRTSTEYIAGFSGQPAADEAQRRRRIVMIDITGDAAIAKIELDYPTTKFVDYMSLLRVDGTWRIVNKTFNATPKAGS
ncbi:MAG TPA: nuclear transport factor 2 family protein [Rhodothermales bacterium]|nr:nuclear transport factor 2 family protein [Rhodothermales bacterium]